MSEFKTVTPGNEAPPVGPGAVPTESTFVKMAKANEYLANKMDEFIKTTVSLHESVKVNTATINSHSTKISQNTEQIVANNGQLGRLLTAIDELVAAVKANTLAIDDHKQEVSASAAAVRDHKATSDKLAASLDALKP